MNYQKALKIDKDSLDEELVRQPTLFDAVATDYVVAVSARDAAKESVDIVRAEAELKIRRAMVGSGEKVTEALIKANIELDAKYLEAMEDFLRLKGAADQLLAHKDAFAQRAFVLKDLCGLYVAGYFSTTAVKGKDAREVGQSAYEQRREEMAKQRRQRRQL